MRTTSLLAWMFLLVVACGCRGPEKLEADRLPFKVAIIPIVEVREVAGADNAFPGKITETARIGIEGAALSEELERALEEYCFAEVELLPVPEGDQTRLAQERTWIDIAARNGVDLLVELDLRCRRELWRSSNSNSWLNVPLFFLFGPAMYILKDQDYAADVELTTTIYDCTTIASEESELGDQVGRLLTSQSHFTGSSLRFGDRIDSRFEYLYSLLVPTGFLARDTESVGSRVSDDVVQDLARQVVLGVQARRADLLHADHVSPVEILPETVDVRRGGSNDVNVRGRVRMHGSGYAGDLHVVRLRAGNEVATAVFEPAAGPGGAREYRFEGSLPSPEEHVQVEFVVGERDRLQRSYTFPVAP